MAETILSQSPGDLSILNLTSIGRAILGILNILTPAVFLLLAIGRVTVVNCMVADLHKLDLLVQDSI